jgi:hypothetical protein
MDKSPLEMNCEDAVSFIRDYVQQHPRIQDTEFPDFSPLTNFAFLDKVSQLLLVPELTECVGIAFHPLLPELVGRWAGVELERTEDVACALGRLIYLDPRLKRCPLFLVGGEANYRYAQELLLERPSFLGCIAHLTPTSISGNTWDNIPVSYFPRRPLMLDRLVAGKSPCSIATNNLLPLNIPPIPHPSPLIISAPTPRPLNPFPRNRTPIYLARSGRRS